MDSNRELWEKGDFTRIAEAVRGSGEAFVAGLGVGPGTRMLDLGCGDGTTALPAAELGADVLGVDIAANLVAAGQARAARAGLDNVTFQQGDACELTGIEDDSFDLVLSVFGAHVRAAPLRRRRGDGAGGAPRRPRRDGQLDPRRPDPGLPDPQDRDDLLAAAPGGVRQPDGVGSRRRGGGPLRRRGRSPPTTSSSSAAPGPSSSTARRRSWPRPSASTTARR